MTLKSLSEISMAIKLDFGRKVLLGTVGLTSIAVPVMYRLANAAPTEAQSYIQNATASGPTFAYEVVSIKLNKSGTDNRPVMNDTPDAFIAKNVPLLMFVQSAYGIFDADRIQGAPSWLTSDRYDVDAKMDSSLVDKLQRLGPDERKLTKRHMLQALLADRFKLTTHSETKELPVYLLVIAKNGPKMQDAKPGDTYSKGFNDGVGRGGAGTIQLRGRGGAVGQGVPTANLADMLSFVLRREVLDKTGLTGKYDFTLEWTPESQGPGFLNRPAGAPDGQLGASAPDSNGPSIFTAIQEELGLKLVAGKGPVEVIVIDHVERPSEN
jgi:uncharacterized protein (TIGR03435 family)